MMNNSQLVLFINCDSNLLENFGDLDTFALLENDLLLLGTNNGKYHLLDAVSTSVNERKEYTLTS